MAASGWNLGRARRGTHRPQPIPVSSSSNVLDPDGSSGNYRRGSSHYAGAEGSATLRPPLRWSLERLRGPRRSWMNTRWIRLAVTAAFAVVLAAFAAAPAGAANGTYAATADGIGLS